MKMISTFIELETGEGISLHNTMPDIKAAIAKSGIRTEWLTLMT